MKHTSIFHATVLTQIFEIKPMTNNINQLTLQNKPTVKSYLSVIIILWCDTPSSLHTMNTSLLYSKQTESEHM